VTDFERSEKPRRRSPQPVAGAVEALAARLEPLTPLAAVQRAWPAAVGPAIAAEAEPVAERGGVVSVRCTSAAWAHELDLMGPELVRRLDDALDGVAVTALRCSARPVRARR
jgi:predicted nucleic acid-binding Zn ribbon protein